MNNVHGQQPAYRKLINILTLLLALTLCCSISFAANKTDEAIQAKANELKDIKKRLGNLQHAIDKAKQKKQKAYSSVKEVDTTIGQLSKDINRTSQLLTERRQQLKKLIKEQQVYQKKIVEQRQVLAEQLRIFYHMGQEEYLNVLLHPKDMEEITETLDYYQYLYEARLNAINDLKQSIARLDTLHDEIFQQTKKLQDLRLTQIKQKTIYRGTLKQQQALVEKMNQQIKTNAQQAKKLNDDKQALSNVISQLKTQSYQQKNVKFTALRGKLPWPVSGKIVQKFNGPIDGSKLKSNGVIISAKTGTNVQSIAPGKVIFSDWLKGYGLLIIIDHGQGYLSLYGHNNTLFKKADETVQGGTIIAQVGKSGGQSKSGLYFEIRRKRTPVNPARWCKKR